MNKEKVKYGLENRELKLSFWEKVQHYEIVGVCLMMPVIFSFIQLKYYFENSTKPIKSGEIWFLIIPSLLGILFFYLQKNRLKFKEVNTNLNNSQIKKIVDKVATELEWYISVSNSKIIIATTNPEFLFVSGGEQITILFDNKKILVNSICDPNSLSSIVSMGRNRQNENKLIEEIKKANRYPRV